MQNKKYSVFFPVMLNVFETLAVYATDDIEPEQSIAVIR